MKPRAIKTGPWQWRGNHRIRSISCGVLSGAETHEGGRYSITIQSGLDPVTSPLFAHDYEAKDWLLQRERWEAGRD